MDLQVHPHSIPLTDELRAFIDRRLGRLDRYLDRVVDAKLELREDQRRTGGPRQVAQLTIATSFGLLRAEEEAADVRAAVDAVAAKMERQVARYRSKWKSRRRGHHAPAPDLPEVADEPEDAEAAAPAILRTKSYSAKPATPEEAIDQMELLGHTFFVFVDAGTGATNVVYRRKQGGYGLLRPE